MVASKRASSRLVPFAFVLSASPLAFAQTRNTALAEALFREGKQLMGEGNYADGCPKLAESQRLDPGTGTLLNLAACHEAQGLIATAWAEFGEAAAMSRRDGRADREAYAAEHAKALEARIPKLVLDVTPAAAEVQGLEIRIDDVLVGRVAWTIPAPTDPGAHVVTAIAPGKKAFRAEVAVPATPELVVASIPALEDAPVVAAPAAAPVAESAAAGAQPPPDHGASDGSSQRTIGLAVGGGGLVALGVGGYFGLRAFSKWGERNDHCKNGCDATAVAASDAAHTSASVADVAVGVGLVGVGVGAYLFFSAPSGKQKETAQHGWFGVGAVGPRAPGLVGGGVW